MRLWIIRFETQRPAIERKSFLEFSLARQSGALIVVGLHEFRLDAQSLGKVSHRLVQLPLMRQPGFHTVLGLFKIRLESHGLGKVCYRFAVFGRIQNIPKVRMDNVVIRRHRERMLPERHTAFPILELVACDDRAHDQE